MMNRRALLQAGVSAAALSSLPLGAGAAAAQGFQLKVMATSWGFEGPVDAFCAKARQEGFDGAEIWWPEKPAEQQALFAASRKHNLQIGFLVGGRGRDWPTHLATFKSSLDQAIDSPQRPLYINCHSGRDYFSDEQNQAFIDYTTLRAKQTGLKILHETHRSRMLFAPRIARQFLERNPDMRLTLDVSHWCVVSESLLEDQQETMEVVLPRVDHIHARIGHPDGPQVNDPRAPEWAEAVQAHFEWWNKVIALKRQQGGLMTVLTEFGPPPYTPTLPYTQQPVSDQWAINVYMMQQFRQRYGQG